MATNDPYKAYANSPILEASRKKQGTSAVEPQADSYPQSSPIVGAGYAKQAGISAGLYDELAAEEETQQNSSQEATEASEKKLTMAQMARIMAQSHQLSPEQREKMSKRRKRETMWSAIGDGLSALANLYFTNQYAPNVKEQGQLSKKNQERWEKWDADMKERDKDYATAIQKAEQAEQELLLKKRAQDNADRKADAQIYRWKAQSAVDEAKKAYYNTLADAKEAGIENDKALALAKEAETQARTALLKAQKKTEEGKPAVQQSEINKNNAQAKAAMINANANQTRANKTGRSSGGGNVGRYGKSGNGKYYAYDENDNIHWFQAEKAAEDYAIEHHTYVEDFTTTTTTQGGVIPKTNTSRKRSGWHSEPKGNGGKSSTGGKKKTGVKWK